MEDILKKIIDNYKEDFQKKLIEKRLKPQGGWAVLNFLSFIMLMVGAVVSMIDIVYYSITQIVEQRMFVEIVFAVFFGVMLIGYIFFYYQSHTKEASEVERREKIKKLRYDVWKESIDKYVTNDKANFFAFLLKVYAGGTKKRKMIVTFIDWIITGAIIISCLPGFDAIKTSNYWVKALWFIFLLFYNLALNGLISMLEDKILKENYYVCSLVEDYTVSILAKYE